MKSFRIVDGDVLWDKKEKFVELYNQELLMKQILDLMDISSAQYNKLVRECAEEGLIVPRRKPKKKIK